MLNEIELVEKYEEFMALIRADSRAEKLLKLYEDFGQMAVMTAPASSKVHYHNAFPGGYIDHCIRVAVTALELSAVYKKGGGEIDYTKQELLFSALHHDLGKLGTPTDGPYYVEQTSDWHLQRGERYTHNESLSYMTVPERGLMVLQRYGIELTEREWLSIRLSDGLYDETTKPYLVNHKPFAIKTALPRIIHWADHMSSEIERLRSRIL